MDELITIVRGDDWEGLYLNGILQDEGHSLRLEEVLRAFGHTVKIVEADYAWLESRGTLPMNMGEVKTEGEET